ncbi:hypothetical protein DLAC_04414 [Tieghemostelium lacteum]|uniref:F-box domain-containing protein n=1 Tax=Tieghemostelium lacteum TaxID=361077 RepID=A0A151ZJF4_TIELA|nr:hypothetical protein DLAC_04414 [Tieghemostelium lacteum]|eukprot:KYQ94131.1 hypothetical protein DLAC_04414 [Tieghemostelium lacteum]
MSKVIPHHFIKEVLDYHLNSNNQFDFIFTFLKKFTVVSKSWNQAIIPHLSVKQYIKPTSSDTEWNRFKKLAKKYNFSQYRVFLPEYCLEYTTENVVCCDIRNVDKNTLDKLEKYNQLEKVNIIHSSTDNTIFVTFKDWLNTINKSRKQPLHYGLTYVLDREYSDDFVGDLSQIEYMLNSIEFKEIIFSKLTISGITKPLIQQINGLVEIFMDKVIIDQWILDSIIDHSPFVKSLRLENLEIQNESSLDNTLKKLSTSQMDLDFLRIESKQNTSNFMTVLEFLNLVKSTEVRLSMDIICDNITEILKNRPRINNPTIKMFEFSSLPLITSSGSRVLKNRIGFIGYNLLDFWGSKDQLHDIRVFYADAITPEISNLRTLTFLANHSLENEISAHSIVKMNMPTLTHIDMRGLPSLVSSSLIQANRIVNKMNIYKMEFNEFIKLLEFNHPSLQSLIIDNVKVEVDKVKVFVTTLQQNRNLMELLLYYTFIPRGTQVVQEIQEINKNLQHLIIN